ncbi:MAG: hypothetical protein JW751_24425 [Polyangiaceae bacterium]|nr:hypothetical protein [Polyangiaceae bacterium]
MRHAIIVASSYNESSQLAALPSALAEAHSIAARIGAQDTGIQVHSLVADRDLPERMDELLWTLDPQPEAIIVYFGGYAAWIGNHAPALVLNAPRLRAYSLSRLCTALERRAPRSLLVLDVRLVVDSDRTPAEGAEAICDLLDEAPSVEAIVVAHRAGATTVAGSPFTQLFLGSWEWLAAVRGSVGATSRELYQLVQVGERMIEGIVTARYSVGGGEVLLLPPIASSAPPSPPNASSELDAVDSLPPPRTRPVPSEEPRAEPDRIVPIPVVATGQYAATPPAPLAAPLPDYDDEGRVEDTNTEPVPPTDTDTPRVPAAARKTDPGLAPELASPDVSAGPAATTHEPDAVTEVGLAPPELLELIRSPRVTLTDEDFEAVLAHERGLSFTFEGDASAVLAEMSAEPTGTEAAGEQPRLDATPETGHPPEPPGATSARPETTVPKEAARTRPPPIDDEPSIIIADEASLVVDPAPEAPSREACAPSSRPRPRPVEDEPSIVISEPPPTADPQARPPGPQPRSAFSRPLPPVDPDESSVVATNPRPPTPVPQTPVPPSPLPRPVAEPEPSVVLSDHPPPVAAATPAPPPSPEPVTEHEPSVVLSDHPPPVDLATPAPPPSPEPVTEHEPSVVLSDHPPPTSTAPLPRSSFSRPLPPVGEDEPSIIIADQLPGETNEQPRTIAAEAPTPDAEDRPREPVAPALAQPPVEEAEAAKVADRPPPPETTGSDRPEPGPPSGRDTPEPARAATSEAGIAKDEAGADAAEPSIAEESPPPVLVGPAPTIEVESPIVIGEEEPAPAPSRLPPPAEELTVQEHVTRARSLALGSRFDEALLAVSRAIKLAGDDEDVVADLHGEAAGIARQRGDVGRAVAHYEEVLSRRPIDKDALFWATEILCERGEFARAAHLHELCLAALDSPADQEGELDTLASLWIDRAHDMAKGRTAIEALIALRGDELPLLERLATVLDGLGEYEESIRVRRRLAYKLAEDPERRARVLIGAARVAHDRLQKVEFAVDLAEQALRADPGAIDALEFVAAVLIERRDWPLLARSFEAVLEKLPDGPTARDLARRLGALCRDELNDPRRAARALERAAAIEPNDPELRLELVTLLELCGDSPRALHHCRAAVRANPRDPHAHHRAHELARRVGAHDLAWNAAHALDFLGEADINASLHAETHRPKGLLNVSSTVTEAHWEEGVFSPDRDAAIIAILRLVQRTAIAHRLDQLARARQLPTLDPSLRIDPEASTTTLARSFLWTSRLLSIPQPALYVHPTLEVGLLAPPAKEPSSVVNRALGSGLELPELAFLWGRHLTIFRPEYHLLVFFPTIELLTHLVTAAFAATDWTPRSANFFDAETADLARHIHEELDDTERAALAAAMEQIQLADAPNRMLGWARNVELTAARAGLVACGDVSVAAALTERFPVGGHTSAFEEVSALLAYTASDEYTTLRLHLGITVRS